jgi:heptosyltransferase-2
MPEVRSVIATPFHHGPLQLRERWKLGRELKGRYDQAYVLPNTWKSALVPFFAGIPRRTGYVGEARYGLLNDARKATGASMAAHYAALGGGGPVVTAALRVSADEIEQAKRKFGIAGRYAVLCPGAEYGPAKRWPYFKELATRLALPAVLLGSRKDAEASGGISGTDLMGKDHSGRGDRAHRRRGLRRQQRLRADARGGGARPPAGRAVRLVQPGAHPAAVAGGARAVAPHRMQSLLPARMPARPLPLHA